VTLGVSDQMWRISSERPQWPSSSKLGKTANRLRMVDLWGVECYRRTMSWWCALFLLPGLGGGAVVAAIAGARRWWPWRWTSGALDSLLHQGKCWSDGAVELGLSHTTNNVGRVLRRCGKQTASGAVQSSEQCATVRWKRRRGAGARGPSAVGRRGGI
jgi:hypothetical protein